MLTRRLHGQGQDTEWETEAQYEDEIVRRSALTLWLSTHLLTTLLTRSEFYRKRRILIIGWSRHEETHLSLPAGARSIVNLTTCSQFFRCPGGIAVYRKLYSILNVNNSHSYEICCNLPALWYFNNSR